VHLSDGPSQGVCWIGEKWWALGEFRSRAIVLD